MSEAAWVAKNARRVELVDKLFDLGLSAAELAELDDLQLEAGRQAKTAWASLAELEALARSQGLPPAT